DLIFVVKDVFEQETPIRFDRINGPAAKKQVASFGSQGDRKRAGIGIEFPLDAQVAANLDAWRGDRSQAVDIGINYFQGLAGMARFPCCLEIVVVKEIRARRDI